MYLPLEVMHLIVESAMTHERSAPLEALDSTSRFPCIKRKPGFSNIEHLSSTCHWLHKVVHKLWFNILYVREGVDWTIAKDLGICVYVREIRVLSTALTENTSNTTFHDYPNLHTAFIDAHNDFVPASEQTPSSHNRVALLGRYHLLTSHMPQSLRRLWVVNAHGPDASVIQALCNSCPELEELLISRCTIFSPRLENCPEENGIGVCKYWALFPGEHDSYFSADGVEEYALSLAQKLKPLSNLKKLHVGLYLTPNNAIEQHSRDHVGETSNRSLWSMPCNECSASYSDSTRTAEETASRIIFSSQLSLAEISWASFLTEGRIGVSLHTRRSVSAA